VRSLKAACWLPAIYLNVLSPVMVQIGDLWGRGAINIAQEKLSTQITLGQMAKLRLLQVAPRPSAHRILVSCVEGEEHYIGARMKETLNRGDPMLTLTRQVVAGLAEGHPLERAEDGENGFLPYEFKLRDLPGSNINGSVVDMLETTLLNPVRDLTTHHGKRIRGQLVALGIDWSAV
jgi:B12 binding domain